MLGIVINISVTLNANNGWFKVELAIFQKNNDI